MSEQTLMIDVFQLKTLIMIQKVEQQTQIKQSFLRGVQKLLDTLSKFFSSSS